MKLVLECADTDGDGDCHRCARGRGCCPKTRPSTEDGLSSCDWGGCDDDGEFWRWSDQLNEWLPVCRRHSTKLDRVP